MSRAKLRHEVDDRVVFWGYEEEGALIGVMGIQHVDDVTLIRHAYVRPTRQGEGIGGCLLSYLCRQTDRPILIGTWADAEWAIRFYEKHGFQLVSREEKERLLRRYWSIPERQVETSVVLVDREWLQRQRHGCQQEKLCQMTSQSEPLAPRRLLQPCGADCSQFKLFLTGDLSGLVNPETDYRCCWLPVDYPEGSVCPIAACCRQKALLFCGECDQLDRCERMEAFYAQPGYDVLRRRTLGAVSGGVESAGDGVPGVGEVEPTTNPCSIGNSSDDGACCRGRR